MKKNAILEKAIYIQYPLKNKTYINYGSKIEIHKLPIPKNNMMYSNWEKNDNHFTTEYHRLYSLPLLSRLLDFNFDENNFKLVGKKINCFDISMLHPKNRFEYEVYGYNRNEHFIRITYDDLLTNNSIKDDITDYHRLYKYSHESSRIINKTLKNDNVLFISGDSQMIPDIPILSCYFKEIWYIDNRDNLVLSNYYEDIIFSHVLIELNDRPLNQYININLK